MIDNEEDISSSTSKSTLSENVIAILNKGMTERFKGDRLNLVDK